MSNNSQIFSREMKKNVLIAHLQFFILILLHNTQYYTYHYSFKFKNS